MSLSILDWARSIAEIGQVSEALVKSLQSVCEASYHIEDQFMSTGVLHFVKNTHANHT